MAGAGSQVKVSVEVQNRSKGDFATLYHYFLDTWCPRNLIACAYLHH
jgi:hypothetical protein